MPFFFLRLCRLLSHMVTIIPYRRPQDYLHFASFVTFSDAPPQWDPRGTFMIAQDAISHAL